MKEKIIYENDDVVIVMREKEKKQIYSEEDNDYGIVHSMYARFFDEFNEHFSRNKEYDEDYIKAIERYANKVLEERGYIFLNQVYELLGLPKTVAGQVVGWFYGDDSEGDRIVKFDLNVIIHNNEYRGFLIDFNVDGNILTKMNGESK